MLSIYIMRTRRVSMANRGGSMWMRPEGDSKNVYIFGGEESGGGVYIIGLATQAPAYYLFAEKLAGEGPET
jgi:hypothetical protein